MNPFFVLRTYLANDKYHMPRLSLYKPEKGADYKFIDRQASEMFQAGGTDVYLHKYLGSNTSEANKTADQPNYSSLKPTNIQDLLLLENRDRQYDTEIYRIRGLYNVQNIDFNLSQFGLFIDNDTLYMTVHINDFIKYIGRKPISGDVLELPHLRDDFALSDFDVSMPRYYVIEDVSRASEGFSVTWFPHLYRLKIKKVTDGQQFAQIFNQNVNDANGNPTDITLRDLLSTHNKELQINDQVVAQAEADAPKSGFETRQFYTLAADPLTGNPLLTTADEAEILASTDGTTILASSQDAVPERTGYQGYLLGDGAPVNGYIFGHGIQFPATAATDDFFLRTDFLPNRLFRFNGKVNAWIAVEDAVRMDMTNNDNRQTLKTSFINNTNYIYNNRLAVDVAPVSDITVTVINTQISYPAPATAKYLVFKQSVISVEIVIADNPGLFTSYNYTNVITGITSACVQINLPTPVAPATSVLPYTGTWTVTLYGVRESQRQSISEVLKPGTNGRPPRSSLQADL